MNEEQIKILAVIGKLYYDARQHALTNEHDQAIQERKKALALMIEYQRKYESV